MGAVPSSVLGSYARNAETLVARFEALSSDAIFAPFDWLIPAIWARVVDIGAGTGRDAAWFAARGHKVTAVEPTSALRQAGETRHCARIRWISDTLPELAELRGKVFDFVLVNAVWHHLSEEARSRAMDRLYSITETGGHALISLRLGPQPLMVTDPAAEAARAAQAGFTVLRQVETASQQDHNRRAGVTWNWLALKKEGAA